MNMMERKKNIETIKAEILKKFPNAKIKNIGRVFFVEDVAPQELKNSILDIIHNSGVWFEVLDLDAAYYFGSCTRAMALQETFGGKTYLLDENAGNTTPYVWEQCCGQTVSHLNYDEVVDVIFY